MPNNSVSFEAGIEAAEAGHNINNSYPFDRTDFIAGYRTVKPNAKTMLDECTSPQQRLAMLEIIKLTENG